MLFLKTKKAKAPSMKPPQNEQPKISLLWRSSYLGWSSHGCRSGSSALNTSFSHAQISGWGSRAGWVPSQCYLAAPSVLSAYSEDKFMPCLHPESPKSKLFLFSPFIKIFVFGDSASSKSCLYWPFPLQLPSSVHLPVLARGIQVCTKMWQFSLLIYLRLLLFIDSSPSQHNFPSWSKLWAPLSQWEFCLFLSSGQDFLCHLQIPSWICSLFYHLCLLWNLLPILLKYSVSVSSNALPLKRCTVVESPCREARGNFRWKTLK